MGSLNLKSWLVPKGPSHVSNDGRRSLKTCCQNPAHHLPPEILSNIFITHMGHRRREDLSWIKATHVCRHWRKVALSCAELWSTIRLLEPGVTETLVNRSKAGPLTVELDGLDKNRTNMRLLRLVLRQMPRIRSLELNGYLQATLLSGTMVSRAPMLETFVMAADSYNGCGLPSRFMTEGAPRLKHLELGGMNIRQWSLLPLGPSLTHLELRRATTDTGAISLQELLDSLEKMPLIEHLHISESLPEAGDPELQRLSTSSRSAIQLPAIRFLRFNKESLVAISSLLAFIQIPERTAITITSRDKKVRSQGMDELIPVLLASWATNGRRELQEAIVTEREGWSSADEDHLGTTFLLCFNELYEPQNPRHCLKMSFDKPASTTRRFLDSFHRHFDLSPLLSIHIKSESSLTLNDWKHFGQLLPNLKAVRFDSVTPSTPMIHLFDTLRGRTGRAYAKDPTPPQPTPLPFPALCALEFHGVHFDQEDMRYDYDDVLSHCLARAVQYRPEGHRINSIEVIRCNKFDSTDMSHLQRHLPEMKLWWEESKPLW